jgi:small subunit ribosomal protein S7
MSRRHSAEKREIMPDPKYGNAVITKFMNSVMYAGKKSVAELIVYGALDLIESKTKQQPLGVFQQALDNVMPSIEVRSRRVGGATYQVPVEVPARRARTLAVRWLVQFARARREYSMAERLASEILDATQQQGSAWKRKDDIYRMAQANKAFAHYRW